MSEANNTQGSTVAVVSMKKSVEGDCVNDKTAQEISRRLQVVFDIKTNSDIVSSVTEPTDKTKLWWPIDPTTGARIGLPKRWDATLGQWVEIGTGLEIPFRKRRNGTQQVAAGASTVPFNFDDIGTTEYQVTITPFAFVDGAPAAAPANMNNFGFIVTNRTTNQFTAAFFATPTGGLSVLWEVAEIAGTTDSESE